MQPMGNQKTRGIACKGGFQNFWMREELAKGQGEKFLKALVLSLQVKGAKPLMLIRCLFKWKGDRKCSMTHKSQKTKYA
jgi:hypothetical protein